MAAGRLAISAITADTASRDGAIPKGKFRPILEHIVLGKPLGILNQKAEGEAIRLLDRLRTVTSRKGAEKEGADIVWDLAHHIDTPIVKLTLERLITLAEKVPANDLRRMLVDARTLMNEDHGRADTVPRIMENNYFAFGRRYIGLQATRKVMSVGFKKSKTECPEEVSKEIKQEYERGGLDKIEGIKETRIAQRESAGFSEMSASEATNFKSENQQAAFDDTTRNVYLPITELWVDQPKRGIGGDDDSQVQRQVEAAQATRASIPERREIRIPRLVWNVVLPESNDATRKARVATTNKIPERKEQISSPVKFGKMEEKRLSREKKRGLESAGDAQAGPMPSTPIPFIPERRRNSDNPNDNSQPMVQAARKKQKGAGEPAKVRARFSNKTKASPHVAKPGKKKPRIAAAPASRQKITKKTKEAAKARDKKRREEKRKPKPAGVTRDKKEKAKNKVAPKANENKKKALHKAAKKDEEVKKPRAKQTPKQLTAKRTAGQKEKKPAALAQQNRTAKKKSDMRKLLLRAA